jgi:hypothetical protein
MPRLGEMRKTQRRRPSERRKPASPHTRRVHWIILQIKRSVQVVAKQL